MPENWMHRSKANGSHKKKIKFEVRGKTDELTYRHAQQGCKYRSKARGSQQAKREQQDVASKQNVAHRVSSRDMQTCASNPNPNPNPNRKYIFSRVYYTVCIRYHSQNSPIYDPYPTNSNHLHLLPIFTYGNYCCWPVIGFFNTRRVFFNRTI